MNYNYTLADSTIALLIDKSDSKLLLNSSYNFIYNKKDSSFVRFGEIGKEANPIVALLEKVKIRLYNKDYNKVINFGIFKLLFEKLPKTIIEITLDTIINEDSVNIIKYILSNGINVNLLIKDFELDKKSFNLIKDLDITVSLLYYTPEIENSINKLSKTKIRKININTQILEETKKNNLKLLFSLVEDKELLNKINYILFIDSNISCSENTFLEILEFLFEHSIPFLMEPCLSRKLRYFVKEHFKDKFQEIEYSIDDCKSNLYSGYIDADKLFHSSEFLLNNGIDLQYVKDFMDEVWNNDKNVKYRNSIINCTGRCPNK